MTVKPRIAIPTPTASDFEYNSRCWPEYARAVEQCGAEAVEIPLSATQAEVADLATSCQGILLPGSPADVNPQKYGETRLGATAPADLPREDVDELLIQDAHNLYKPIFGICYGLQILNTWRGGTLVQDLLPLPVNHSAGPAVFAAHAIEVVPGSVLGSTLVASEDSKHSGRVFVNSSHHQAIGIPGDNLDVTARSSADGVIEALEAGCWPDGVRKHYVIGVQWHPERSFDSDAGSRALFRHFVLEAQKWAPRPVLTSVVAEL